MGRLRTSSRGVILVVIAGSFTLGAIVGPAAVEAADKITEVLVTNSDSQPVPVKGTVTVANQPGIPPAPLPFQRDFKFSGTGLFVVFGETLYTVPTGKSLTIEYGQISMANSVDVIDASFSVGCSIPQTGAVGRASYELPAVPAGDHLKVFGGPMGIHVPEGACLRFQATTQPEFEGGVEVRGSITGYLSDAP